MANIYEHSCPKKYSESHQCLHFSKELKWLEDRVKSLEMSEQRREEVFEYKISTLIKTIDGFILDARLDNEKRI